MSNDFKIGAISFALLISLGWLSTAPFQLTSQAIKKTNAPAHLKRIYNGAKVTITFDLCPFDDSGWDDFSDPMGGIACGEIYTTEYNSKTQEWNAQGYDEMASLRLGKRRNKQHSGIAPSPIIGNIYIWGVKYMVSADGQVTWFGMDGNSPQVVGSYSTATAD